MVRRTRGRQEIALERLEERRLPAVALGDSPIPAVQGGPAGAVRLAAPATPGVPSLAASDDTGTSHTDGITQYNGTVSHPLDFTVGGVSPPNGFVTLLANGQPLAGPVQASNGTATFHIAGAGPALADGTYAITATQSSTPSGSQSASTAPLVLQVQASLTITGTNPADGAVDSAPPNGHVVVTFSHPLAGLNDGDSPIQNSGTFNPFDVFLLARGPDGVFSAPNPNIPNSGDLPLHADVVYHINADGTSKFVITPTQPISTDVYALSVYLPAFHDLAGNPLTDAKNGYRTALLQLPPVRPKQPLAVVGLSEFNGATAINSGDAILQPDAISIQFNKPLFAGAAGNNNVQIVANPGPNFSVVPSVAAYSPTNDTICVIPTAPLNPGTQYAVRIAGQDNQTTTSDYVSDDQGFGGPGVPLPQTQYVFFTVKNAPAGAGQSPFQVAVDSSGVPQLSPTPSTTSEWTLPVGYASAQFTEPLAPLSLGRYSAMLIPRSGGLDDDNFDLGDLPLNATVAYNPNTDQLIGVPSQPVGDDVFLYSFGNMHAQNGDPFLNNAGQPAGVGGNPPYFATFGLAAGGSAAAAVQAPDRGMAELVAITAVPDVALSRRERADR